MHIVCIYAYIPLVRYTWCGCVRSLDDGAVVRFESQPGCTLKSGSGSSGRSAHGEAKVLYSCSGELRLRPSVVRSVPMASVVGST